MHVGFFKQISTNFFFQSSRRYSTTFNFRHVETLLEQKEQLKKTFNDNGYVILQPDRDDKATVIKACRVFGAIQGHERSLSNDGVVEIRSKSLDDQQKHVTSNLGFFPHTDGVHLEGMAYKKNKVFHVSPPKMVALQCLLKSVSGGENFIVDGRAILLSVIENHPRLIPTLFSPFCMNICRADHIVMNLPVFQKMRSGNFSIRYSYDRDLFIPRWASRDLDFFNKNYVLNASFRKYISLSEKQILIIDNQRLLHGRTAISGDRLFRRIWIQDENNSSEMINPNQMDFFPTYGKSRSSAMSKYQPFIVSKSALKMHQDFFATGIALPIKKLKLLQSQF